MILLEQIRTINQDSLGPYIGIVDDKNVLNTISNGLKKTFRSAPPVYGWKEYV